MTQPELARMVRLWQKRLRLSDWKVTAELCTEADLPDCYGTIPLDAAEMSATLKARDCPLVESVVIHELLHLRLLPFSDGDDEEPEHEEREKAINLLADCFLAAFPKRGKR